MWVKIMELSDLRKEYGLSQLKAAQICGVPLRTYIRYETNCDYGNPLKRKGMIAAIKDACEITEEKGVLTINQIIERVCNVITKDYQDDIDLCYLFGSYAKGYASNISDVDLCVSTKLDGLKFVGFVERLHQELHKNVDVVRLNNINNELILEIMKDGIKIYG